MFLGKQKLTIKCGDVWHGLTSLILYNQVVFQHHFALRLDQTCSNDSQLSWVPYSIALWLWVFLKFNSSANLLVLLSSTHDFFIEVLARQSVVDQDLTIPLVTHRAWSYDYILVTIDWSNLFQSIRQVQYFSPWLKIPRLIFRIVWKLVLLNFHDQLIDIGQSQNVRCVLAFNGQKHPSVDWFICGWDEISDLLVSDCDVVAKRIFGEQSALVFGSTCNQDGLVSEVDQCKIVQHWNVLHRLLNLKQENLGELYLICQFGVGFHSPDFCLSDVLAWNNDYHGVRVFSLSAFRPNFSILKPGILQKLVFWRF